MIQGLLQPEEDHKTLPNPLKPSQQQHHDRPSAVTSSAFPTLPRPEPALPPSAGLAAGPPTASVTPNENNASSTPPPPPPAGDQLKKPKSSVRHVEGYKGYNRPAARPTSKERRFKCKFQDCPCLGFHRSTDLERHLQTVHSTQKLFPCVMKRCNRKGENGFSRKDHLSQHLRDVHSLDIPKVWRRSRSAKAASGSEDNGDKAETGT